MRKTGFFIILIILFLSSVSAFAEERNIYAGDLIKLSISGKDISENDIREWFNEFEIVELKKKKDDYSIVLRTFETGTKTIDVNNKKNSY
jgi:TusA-related sulfurtransferase